MTIQCTSTSRAITNENLKHLDWLEKTISNKGTGKTKKRPELNIIENFAKPKKLIVKNTSSSLSQSTSTKK